jgi:fumarate hydratase class I
MDAKTLQAQLLELIRRTSTRLPGDVVRTLEKGWRRERKDSTAKYALRVVLDNIAMARDKSQPLCQDTGTIICYADLPPWCDEPTFKKAYERAVVQAR